MATQTLTEAKKLINNEIVVGVVEDLIDLNPFFALLPFDGFTGQSVVVNREDPSMFDEATAVDTAARAFTDVYEVGDKITSRDAAAFVQYSFSPTKLIGDAELDELVRLTSAGAGVDQTAVEISMKVKGIGRLFQSGMAVQTGTLPQMNSLHSLMGAAAYGNGVNYHVKGGTYGGTTNTELTFQDLDIAFGLVKAKQGQVDFAIAPQVVINQYKKLLRGTNGGPLGGTAADFVMSTPFSDGRQRHVITYEGTPMMVNDYLSVAETAGGAALTGGTPALTSLYCGCFDDGSRRMGVAGIYPAAAPAGIVVESVGAREEYDERVYRVKWYSNFVSYQRQGLARVTDINTSLA